MDLQVIISIGVLAKKTLVQPHMDISVLGDSTSMHPVKPHMPNMRYAMFVQFELFNYWIFKTNKQTNKQTNDSDAKNRIQFT